MGFGTKKRGDRLRFIYQRIEFHLRLNQGELMIEQLREIFPGIWDDTFHAIAKKIGVPLARPLPTSTLVRKAGKSDRCWSSLKGRRDSYERGQSKKRGRRAADNRLKEWFERFWRSKAELYEPRGFGLGVGS
jgi:hypothetical protein